MNFKTREDIPELMDQPKVPVAEIEKALGELEIINSLLGGYTPTIDALTSLNFPVGQEILIVDLASGGGDSLRRVASWARKFNLSTRLIGIDINPAMTSYAESKSKAFPEITYRTMDVFSEELPALHPDIIITSLFCHHLNDDLLTKLLKHARRSAKRAVIINDLHRSPLAYCGIKLLTAAFSRSYLVRYDGPVSVRRGFQRQDWERLFESATIKNYTIKWFWAWRWQVLIDSDEA